MLEQFWKNFGKFPLEPLVIYGVGQNTKYIIEACPRHNIAGLMDEAATGAVLYGKRVLTLDEVKALGVKKILILARSGNLKIIYRRVAGFCALNGISVYDINGSLIKFEEHADKQFAQYANVCREALYKEIEAAGAVSFDVFDTLLMRRCLYPADVFLLLGEDFARLRLETERRLNAEGKYPAIYDVYERMGQGYSPERELTIEKEMLIPRRAMLEALQYAQALRKEVWLTSDMYWPKEIMAELLAGLGINLALDRILVSCDCQAAKNSGLFALLREKAGPVRILHIGDSYEADILSALRCGVDSAFQIYSALTMLEDSYGGELLNYSKTLADRMFIGEFIAKTLNDPFLFSKTQGKFAVNSDEEMARDFIAPLIYRFFAWLVTQARELELEEILLGARDGYLIARIYQLLQDQYDLPLMRYFYISRTLALIAGLIDDDSLIQAARLPWAGSAQAMLRQRFHLKEEDIGPRGEESVEEYILGHKEAIYREAKNVRAGYLRYIAGLGLKRDSRVGFVDYISSGTCQAGLQNLVNFELLGLYFAAIEREPRSKPLEIKALLGGGNIFSQTWHLLDNYFVLENMLPSFEGTLAGISAEGIWEFWEDSRTAEQKQRLETIQRSVLAYIEGSGLSLPLAAKADIHVADLIFHFLSAKYSLINTDYFQKEELVDEFYNRKFDLREE
ncbi:MAG: hypothetical protein LBJ14_09940 [Desulfarculales bacterium]|nr:hypothetical protein [Desulfarculales bacterium]